MLQIKSDLKGYLTGTCRLNKASVTTTRDAWLHYGSSLQFYVKALLSEGFKPHSSLSQRSDARDEALKSHGDIRFSIWDVVMDVEKGGLSAKYYPRPTDKFDVYFCKDGQYRYYRYSGRVQMKGADGEWKSCPRPTGIPKFKDRLTVMVHLDQKLSPRDLGLFKLPPMKHKKK
ncbi:MAG: hypothetical protein Q9M44_07920 [Ghiorsea sp.]|nr:hypothetical protein [Ghiorsea sp.]